MLVKVRLRLPSNRSVGVAVDVPGVAATLLDVFLFGKGWADASSEFVAIHAETASVQCPDCGVTLDVEKWRGACQLPCRSASAPERSFALGEVPMSALPPVSDHAAASATLPVSSLLDRLVFAQLLDALDQAFLGHEDFDEFCEEKLGLNPENFKADRLRLRWKRLIKHCAMHSREPEVIAELIKARPYQSAFTDLANRLKSLPNLAVAAEFVRSAWSDEVSRGVVRPAGRRVGIFIGINQYQTKGDSSLKDLQGCAADAKDLFDTFRRFGSFGSESLLIVDDAFGNKDVLARGGWRRTILGCIEQMIGPLEKADLASFFFAGHGGRILDEGTKVWKSALILPTVGSEAVAGEQYVLIDEINALFRRSRAGSSFRIFDCCYSGQAALRTAEDAGLIGGWLDEFVVHLGDGHCALAASDIDQVAREEHGRGLMSRALGVALRGGEALGTEPLAVDVLTATSQTCEAVVRQTRGEQTPRYELGGRGRLILTAVSRMV